MTTQYWLLSLLAFLTTTLVVIHTNWLIGVTVLLIILWGYAIAALLFRRPRSTPLSLNLVPGDPENLDQLYQRAMKYCNEIIDHYQNARYSTRRYYIVSQILTATLSGLTPILVLVDRNDTLTGMMPSPFQSGLTWAILILPGIAAVLATTSTVFNFQEEWIQAKKTAEALEAVREEFVIGASPQYQVTARDPVGKLQQRKQALDNFIVSVNALHLKQVDQWASSQRAATQQTPAPLAIENVTPTQQPTDAIASPSSMVLSSDEAQFERSDRDLALSPPQNPANPDEEIDDSSPEEPSYLI